MRWAEVDSRRLLLTERVLQDPSITYLDSWECFLTSPPFPPPRTLLKYGHGMSYFHPGAFHALVFKGREGRNMSQKYGLDWFTIMAVWERVGRAEKGTDAQCVLGPLHSVM